MSPEVETHWVAETGREQLVRAEVEDKREGTICRETERWMENKEAARFRVSRR